jgi:adenylosuccinate lyase
MTFLIELKKDDTFKAVHDKLDSIMDPKQYVGRAPEQVENFIKNEVKPAIKNFELGSGKAELSV